MKCWRIKGPAKTGPFKFAYVRVCFADTVKDLRRIYYFRL